jgi:hypothetical protein
LLGIEPQLKEIEDAAHAYRHARHGRPLKKSPVSKTRAKPFKGDGTTPNLPGLLADDLDAITAGWPVINQRRSVLIDKEYEGKITDAELKELNQLQRQASLRRQLLAPYPTDELRQERERLKREGKWDE